MIDVNYLIALGESGGVVPGWQDVPVAARINAANVWRLRGYNNLGVPILVLSYPWLDRHHPDKHGATLRRILPILRAEKMCGPRPEVCDRACWAVLLSRCVLLPEKSNAAPWHPRPAEPETLCQC